MNKEIRNYLRSILYHNLAKVHVMYKKALRVDVFKALGDEKKIVLFKAVDYRHDCVHRNGFDKDGNKLDVFTKEFVQGVADIAKELVNFIHINILFAGVSSVSSAELNHSPHPRTDP